MNIPMILSEESINRSLLPAPCWRHHTLQSELITGGGFRGQKKTDWWNIYLGPLRLRSGILNMPNPSMHVESDLRQLSKL